MIIHPKEKNVNTKPRFTDILRISLLRHVFQMEFCVYYHRERNFFTDLQKKRLTNESHIICVVDPPQEENICGNFGKPLAFAPKIVYTIDMQ